jgi:hypothetical protein
MKISHLMVMATVVKDVKAQRSGTTGIQATLLLFRTVRRGPYSYKNVKGTIRQN